jgi:hypothetical protein
MIAAILLLTILFGAIYRYHREAFWPCLWAFICFAGVFIALGFLTALLGYLAHS